MIKPLLISLMLLPSVAVFAQKSKEVVHFNIVFAPDLSNRLNTTLFPKAVSDVDVVDGVLKQIYPVLRIKRSEGQLDRYSVDFINRKLIGLYQVNTDLLKIDFQHFEGQKDRINYVMSRGVDKTLPKDVSAFLSTYQKFNTKAAKSNNGADIWSYFQSGIDERIILSDLSKGKVKHKFRNIMVMMTDGYIEAGIYNKGYDLSAAKVKAFRTAFLKSKEQNLDVFLSRNPKFKIVPARNANLKNLELIVIEMYDRSLSKSGAATAHPTDMEIMKVIWKDWLLNSGLKRFELKAAASNKSEAIKFVMDFIKVSNH